MKSLTTAEEEIMQVLWKLENAFVKEVIAELPEPKPAYNTVSTIIRILEKKGFVDHEAFGKTFRYFPLTSKAAYQKQSTKTLLKSYFGNSFTNLVSFFAKEGELSKEELTELEELLKKHKNDN